MPDFVIVPVSHLTSWSCLTARHQPTSRTTCPPLYACSQISALSGWSAGENPGRVPDTFPSAASSPPVVRSITIEDVSDIVAVHTVYALLSRSLAVPTGHLARVAVHAAEENQLSAFSGFAGAIRRLFSELELHVVRPSRKRCSLFSVSGVPLTAPTPQC